VQCIIWNKLAFGAWLLKKDVINLILAKIL